MQRRVALYVRVSTSEQTTSNQKRELKGAAKRHGWQIVEVFEDAGISGAKGREKRPGLDGLLRGVARKDFDMIAAWSVDRLGRSLQDLVGILEELRAKSCDLYLHQQGLDTSTPAGRAMYQMMGVFAEFERLMMGQRIRAGQARARAEGKTFGRPRVPKEVEDAIRGYRRSGLGIRWIAKKLSIGVSVVQRVSHSQE